MRRSDVRCILFALCLVLGLVTTESLSAQSTPTMIKDGEAAPDFAFVDKDGKQHRLNDFRGKVVVVDFWATWCGPCIASMPHLDEVVARHTDDVIALAVCTSDSKTKFDLWVKANAEKYPHLVFVCDPNDRDSKTFDDRASLKHYRVAGLPTKFVVKKDGTVAAGIVGTEDDDYRLEAGLARAGCKIDPKIAERGEAQILENRRQEALEIEREASRPTFFPMFGAMSAKTPIPDFTLTGPDGKEFKFSSFRGKPVMLAFAWAEVAPTTFLDEVVKNYGGYGLEIVSVVVSSSRAEFDAWVEKKASGATYRIGHDPAGKFEAAADDAEVMAKRSAWMKQTVLGRFFTGNMMPAMPAFIIADKDGAFIASFSRNRWQDSLGNILTHLGVELRPEQQPSKKASPEDFVAKPKAPPEAPVTLIKNGVDAPDFSMIDVGGKTVKLSDFRGKTVVLDFWATWCGPCKSAMPHVQEVAEKYKDQGVVVVASCTNDERRLFDNWVKVNQENYPSVIFLCDTTERSPNRASRTLYGVSGIPHQFVIGKDGKIVAQVDGYMKGEVLLDAALAEAGIKVDPAILEKAKADRAARLDQKKAAPMVVPAAPLR